MILTNPSGILLFKHWAAATNLVVAALSLQVVTHVIVLENPPRISCHDFD